MWRGVGVIVGWLAFTLVGCGNEPGEGPGEYNTGQTVLAVKAYHKKKGGKATHIKFSVYKMHWSYCKKDGQCYKGGEEDGMECGGHPWLDLIDEATEPLIGTLPDGYDAFKNNPLDENSEHQFTDHYFVLPTGCYAVAIQPLIQPKCMDEMCKPKKTCTEAIKKGVKVKDGKTTEVLLISQCKGEKVGGLDVIGVLNYPPVITALEFNHSKFEPTCGDAEVCVTAKDPDADPMTFEWTQVSGPEVPDPVGGAPTPTDGSMTACATLDLSECGKFEFKVTVFDMVWDGPIQVKMEDWLNENYFYHKYVKSRDSLVFPKYVACPCGLTPR